MRMRHRVPMVFSLSMLDVFCCALGCVTLLWLINQREAMLRAKDASRLTSVLDVTRSDLKQLRSQMAAAVSERDQLKDAARRLAMSLTEANEASDRLSKDLATATRRADDVADRLSKSQTDLQMLTRDANAAKSKVAELSEKLQDENARVAAADRRVEELSTQLRDADALTANLKTTAAMVPGLQQAAGTANEKLTSAQDRVRILETELETARRAMAGIDTEKKDLVTRLARAQMAVENRFEGITLTGKRVVFLVDMSGSMELVDANTSAPNKWNAVRDTLTKLYRSLPDLEKYQVILFSDQVLYPLGNEGQWLNPEPRSAERIQLAMNATRPKGNTNMYIAMDAAFRYRAAGLDTIYLLSDGLPNIGEGLSQDQAARMTETQRSEALSRVIRNALRTNWNAAQSGRPRVRINSVGFFYESPEVGAFLWALSRENDGSFVGMSKP